MEKPQLEVVKNNMTAIFKTYDELNTLLSNQDKRGSEYLQCKKYFDTKKYLLKQLQESKYYIAFVGPYSTGKSTLINAMLQRDLLPENLEKATTAFPTYIYPVSAESGEKAEIVYCSQSERDALKKFYLEILADEFEEIKDDLDEYLSMDPTDLLEDLEEFADNSPDYDEKPYDTLCNLLNKWDINVGETESVSIDTVVDYVESNDNAVIISRADIYVNIDLFSGRKDIVLVDLPGVDADNPRHFDTTKRFTITDAKSHAYIFVSAPEKIDSGKANEFLLELAKHTKQISKAFWVLNRCDLIPENDIKQTVQQLISNNKKKIKMMDEQRVFAVSAKLYKDDAKNINPLVADIGALRTKFMDYLQNEFEYELAETHQKEYDQLKQKMLTFLETKVGNLKAIPQEDKELAIELELVQNRINDWFFETEQALETTTAEIGEKIANLDFFNENLIASIKTKIDNAVKEVGVTDYTPINLPKDIENRSPESKIIDFQNGVLLNQYIRTAFVNALENEGSLSDILECFNAISSHKTEVFKEQKAIHSEITQRFEGICDIALIGYENVFNECVPLVIKGSLGINIYCRAFFMLEAEDCLADKITVVIDKKQVSKTLINFVLDTSITYEVYTTIATDLGMKEEYDSFNPDDDEYNNYIQSIVKHKMYIYLETQKVTLNQYVSVCLTNYFKDLFSVTKEVLNSDELAFKLRLQFTKDLKIDNNVVQTENEKKAEIANLYTQLT